ncbi:MAG TPA: nucleotidyltransferase domain-containing protein [Bacteroidales bacterium]|jgi:predicted nucleotidyltransferase|nr:nucleotidyltransferase domain-containing protein [Bacteroidales bacterium]HQM69708.1 nucleotidyltransferase domain-containing protein [Bacteroidales bacterium]
MDKAAINEIIAYLKQSLIKHGIHVDSIAIFGSALSEKMGKDSDIDIIIISSDFQNLDLFERARLTMKPEIETLKRFKIPMDVINLSPEEYNKSNLKIFYRSKIVA